MTHQVGRINQAPPIFNILRRQNISNIQAIETAQLVTLASAITAIAGCILGSFIISKGLIASLIGIPIFLVGVGSIYLCYNTFYLSRNMERLNNNPLQLLPGVIFGRDTLVSDLSRNTLLFRWCVNLLVQS